MLTRRATLAFIFAGTLIVTASAGPIPHTDAPLAQSAAPQVPFADQGAEFAVNYNRLRPHISTGGLLKEGAIPKLKALGFESVVDLRGPNEGTASEKAAAETAGLRYFNIPVTDGLPLPDQIAEFARIVEDPNNAPLMIHCGSGNRVGAMWALYRALKGIPEEIAFDEARTIGLQPDREAAVRKWLAEHIPTK